MCNMKTNKMKQLAFVAAMGLCTTAFAQQMTVNQGSTTFGLRAGVNAQTINGKDAGGTELKNGVKTGFHAGLNAEIPIGSGFYVQPGLLYSAKGAEWAKSDNNDVRLNYLELPVNFIYKPVLGTGNLVLGFGPYAALAVNSNVESNGTKKDIDFDAQYNANDRSTHFQKFDAGANVLAGYEFNRKVALQLNAQLGVTNNFAGQDASGNDKVKYKNTGFGLSLGYRF
jgi:hypothetical protein